MKDAPISEIDSKKKIQEYKNAVEEHLQKISPLLLKGTLISQESFTKIRKMMAFEDVSQAMKRVRGKKLILFSFY